MRIIVYCIIQQ